MNYRKVVGVIMGMVARENKDTRLPSSELVNLLAQYGLTIADVYKYIDMDIESVKSLLRKGFYAYVGGNLNKTIDVQSNIFKARH